MLNCPSCQAQMLEHLYGLLDDGERQALEAHLAGCAACQAALDRAKEQQRLLAAAARMEFPLVQFMAPTKEEAPAVVPMPAPAKKRAFPWRRWAAAAAILAVIGGLAWADWRIQQDAARADQTVQKSETRIADATKAIKDTVAEIQKLPKKEREQTDKIREEERAAQLKVDVVGPADVQAGAPAAYQIETWNLNGQPVATDVKVQVVAAGRRVVAENIPVIKAEEGKSRIVLPPDLPVKPDSRLTLVVSAKRFDGVQAQVSAGFDLEAPVYLTHLETDKPMYQPGEVVHYRSLTLDRFSLKPAEEDLKLTYELVTPTGGKKPLVAGANGLREEADQSLPVLGPDNKPVRGVGAGDFRLDANLQGGEYALVCREENNRFPEQRRKFLVNAYARQQLNKKLDFGRSTYGPGDEVSAVCTATLTGTGEPVRNQPVEATVLIDDHRYGADGHETAQAIRSFTDDKGKVVVHFRLPDVIERGEASLGVKFLGKPVETISKPLPIVVKKLNVEFYPEGGDLAAELPNRVYFEVRTPLGKPADLKGVLLEDGKALPVTVETLHDDAEPGVNQGMGRFEFTPKSGKKYELQIDSPAGITQHIALPGVLDDRVALSVPGGVFEAGKPITATVHSKTPRDLMVGLYCRGRLLQSVQLKNGEDEAVLNPEAGVGGVCRVTVFEEPDAGAERRELKPVAERLVYRRPAEALNVKLTPDQSSYVPGQKATLHVEAETETGEPAPAVVMLAVVDKSVLTLADEKTYRSMPTHFLLTSEVRRPQDLEYADFLLGPQAKAEQALDLLLGVQGWRRFAEQDPANFRKKSNVDKEEADRLVVMSGQSPRRTDLVDAEIKKIRQETNSRYGALTDGLERAKAELAASKTDPVYAAALAKRDYYDRFWQQARAIGMPLAGALLLTAALIFLLAGLRSRRWAAAPWYAAAAASMALIVGVVAWHQLGAPKAAAPDNNMVAKAEASGLNAGGEEFTAPLQDDARPEFEGANGAFGLRGGDQPMAQGAAGFNMPRGAPGPLAPPPPAPGAGGFPPPVAAAAPGGLGANKPGGPATPPPALDKAEQDKFAAILNLQENLGANVAKDAKDNAKLATPRPEEPAARDLEEAKKADGAMFDDLNRAELKAKRALPDGDRDMARRALILEQNLQNLEKQRQQADRTPLELRQPAPTMVVREYAHARNGAAAPELRSDFAETLYWRPVLVLPTGQADVSFALSDATTSFQATAYAHTLDGRIGAGTTLLQSKLPFALQPAVPIEVTASDKIDVPLSVANNTNEKRDVQLTLGRHMNLDLLSGKETDRIAVDAGKTARPIYRFQPTIKEGEAELGFMGKVDSFAPDQIAAHFRIVPEGFPVAESRSDLLEGSASQTVTLPDTWVKGTLKCRVEAYPSTLADLQGGLESLLREPNGCFEQTSTSNYPNLLILDYLKESNQAKPEVERRARDLLSRGYQKLTSFECMNTAKGGRQGYEWFGGAAPPHEALTAYGLLEFRDMARVQDVDPVMLQRTKDYLLSRRDGKGGFLRNPRALDSFGRAPDDITNAYIIWALTESGKDDDVTKELDALNDQAKTSKDAYFLSLVANSLINRARTDDATALLKTVAGEQKADGHLDAEKTSITGSGGRDLQIETTALAVLGWLKADPGTFNGALQKAVKWIGQQRGGYGGFGSTQSTILALKALIAYTKANKRTAEGGELRLYVSGKEAASLPFAAGVSETLTLELKDAEKVLKPGANAMRVEVTGKNVFPYTLAWTYQTLKPADAADCPVRLDAKLSQTEVQEGDLVRLNVTLENVSGKGQGMATAVLGLPGGLTLPEDMKQLKQYCREPEDGSRPLVSAFEIRGRELVLYWRDLAPEQKIQVPLDLIARIPGEYTGPASRGYLYYNADHKHWVDPLRVVIAAKGE